MRVLFGCLGLVTTLAVLSLSGGEPVRELSARDLQQISGGAWCEMVNYGSSNCMQCLPDGNGGSIKCNSNPQGKWCGPYTNPAYHNRTNCQESTPSCGGNASHYILQPGCPQFGQATQIPCGRTYTYATITQTEYGNCP